MSNRIDKPKLTSKQLVEKLKNEKGVTFKYVSEDEAASYFSDRNNYLRTASYRKNYQKHLKGKNEGKYIALDFAYLQELSIIDMHIRQLITKMCIDIEHDLKVILLNELEGNAKENGYDIVDDFLNTNSRIVEKIEAASASPFTCGLIQKYFTLSSVVNPKNGKRENKITAFDCPAWVLMEILTFGDFIRFYKFYYSKYGQQPISIQVLNLIKSLRNGCAHNNCIICDLNPGGSVAPAEISRIIKQVSEINPNQRQKKMSCRAILEFVTMLCVYNQVVSEKVKRHRIEELKKLFENRIPEKKAFFEKNELICSSYDFVIKVINSLYG